VLDRILSNLNDAPGLEAMYRNALTRLQADPGRSTFVEVPTTGFVLHHLAKLLCAKKALAEARPLAEQAVQLYQRHPDWPGNEADHACQVLVTVLTDQGDLAALEELHRQRLSALQARTPSNDLQIADELNALASVLLQAGKPKEAEPLARSALSSFKEKQPADFRTFGAEAMLGQILAQQDRLKESEPFLVAGCEGMKQCLASTKSSPSGKQAYRQAVGRLVEVYRATGRPETAATWLSELGQ
jgi:hypothetical protein